MKETEYYKNIKTIPNKYKIFNDGVKNGLIREFDASIITKLRKTYYACLNGVLYLYGFPTNENYIANKMEILSVALKNLDYIIVHGVTDSIKDNKKLEFNSWLEVKEGEKIYVYDLVSMLMFEKSLFYELENPKITKTINKEVIESYGFFSEPDYYKPSGILLLPRVLKTIENHLKNNPYKELVMSEITRYKEEIDYENILREKYIEEKEIHKKS